MQAPCKDCPDRILGCHSKCPKYIKYKETREQQIKKRQLEFQVVDYESSVFSKRPKI